MRIPIRTRPEQVSSDAIRWAEEIMKEIDAKWPAKRHRFAGRNNTADHALILKG